MDKWEYQNKPCYLENRVVTESCKQRTVCIYKFEMFFQQQQYNSKNTLLTFLNIIWFKVICNPNSLTTFLWNLQSEHQSKRLMIETWPHQNGFTHCCIEFLLFSNEKICRTVTRINDVIYSLSRLYFPKIVSKISIELIKQISFLAACNQQLHKGHTMAKFLILWGPNSNPNPK